MDSDQQGNGTEIWVELNQIMQNEIEIQMESNLRWNGIEIWMEWNRNLKTMESKIGWDEIRLAGRMEPKSRWN